MVRFKHVAVLIAFSLIAFTRCDKPVAEGDPDFWTQSYFTKTSPYPSGWVNPAKKEYSYAESRALSQTSDGGYILAGFIRTFEEQDALVLKLNSFGQVEMGFSIIGGTKLGEYRQSNFLKAARQTSDGGYIFGGWSQKNTWGNIPTGDPRGMWVVRADKTGKLLWTKAYGSGDVCDIIPTGNDSYLLAGSELIKINAGGNVLWAKRHSQVMFNVITKTPDNGFIAISNSPEGNPNRVIKLSANGDILWSKSYEVPGLTAPRLSDIQVMTDAKGNQTGYLLAGCLIYNENRSSDWLVMAIDESGTLIWEETLGGPVYDPANMKFSDESAVSIIRSADGNYLIAGVSESFSGSLNDSQTIIVKMNANGAVSSQMSYWGHVTDMIKTTKGYAFTGETGSGFRALLASCDNEGNIPGLNIEDISFVVKYPTVHEIDMTGSTTLDPFVPVVSNTGSVANELTVDRINHSIQNQ